MEVGIITLVIILLIVVVSSIKIVPQAQAFVVERLGSYSQTWNNGLHFLVPFVDRISKRVNLKEIVRDFEPQPVITKDNVTMHIDTVVYFQITDAKLYTYGVDNPLNAIEMLTATTLRNLIGDLELDETLTSRDIINSKMKIILDEATSNVDTRTEKNIQNAISTLSKHDITKIIISQRISSVKDCDNIIVLEDGKITAQGTHNSLISSSMLYQEIYNSQGGDYNEK